MLGICLLGPLGLLACDSCGCSGESKKAEPQLISKEVLLELMKKNDGLVIVDVLSPENYANGHIKGAINIPLAQLDKSLDSLKKYKTIVVYCASYKCQASVKAAKLLMKHGFTNVLDYKGGIKEWFENKLPVESKK
jgi:rhodanese-related sulfurtransferase